MMATMSDIVNLLIDAMEESQIDEKVAEFRGFLGPDTYPGFNFEYNPELLKLILSKESWLMKELIEAIIDQFEEDDIALIASAIN
jgi:hypothetical protein